MEIVIKPLDNESNVVCLNVKDELKDILANTNYGPRVISDKNLPALVRHTALHVNVSFYDFLLVYTELYRITGVIPSIIKPYDWLRFLAGTAQPNELQKDWGEL